MAVEGSGGWVPAHKIRLDSTGRVSRESGITTNMPKRFVEDDPAVAALILLFGDEKSVFVDARVTLGAVVKIIDVIQDARAAHAALIGRERERENG